MIDYIKGGSYCENNSQKHSKKCKKYAAKATVSAMMLAGGVMMASPILSSTVSAATEHWNDASASKTESWSTWKANWDKYSTNYENVSLTPGATESQLNFAYYSKTEETPKVKIATFLAVRKK